MRIACPNCTAEYQLDERLIPADGAPVQCTSCNHIFVAMPTAAKAPAQAGQGAPGGPDHVPPAGAKGFPAGQTMRFGGDASGLPANQTVRFGVPSQRAPSSGAPATDASVQRAPAGRTAVFGAVKPRGEAETGGRRTTPVFGTSRVGGSPDDAAGSPHRTAVFGAAPAGTPAPADASSAQRTMRFAPVGRAPATPGSSGPGAPGAAGARARPPTPTGELPVAAAPRAPSQASPNDDVPTAHFGASPNDDAHTGHYGASPNDDAHTGRYGSSPSPTRQTVRFGASPNDDVHTGRFGGAPNEDVAAGRFGGAPNDDAASGRFGRAPNDDAAAGRSGASPNDDAQTGRFGASPSFDAPPTFDPSAPGSDAPPLFVPAGRPAQQDAPEAHFAIYDDAPAHRSVSFDPKKLGLIAAVVIALVGIVVFARALSEHSQTVPREWVDAEQSALTTLRRDDASARAEAATKLDALRKSAPTFAAATADLVLLRALELDDVKAPRVALSAERSALDERIARLTRTKTPSDWAVRVNALRDRQRRIDAEVEQLVQAAADGRRTLEAGLARLPEASEDPTPTNVAVTRARALAAGVEGSGSALELAERYAKLGDPGGWSVIVLAEYALNANAPPETVDEVRKRLEALWSSDPSFLRPYVLLGRLELSENRPQEAASALEAAVALDPDHALARRLSKVASSLSEAPGTP